MAFEFTGHDGHVYRLDTEAGEVHCTEVPQPAQDLPPIEPTDEG